MFPGSRGMSTVDYQRDREARLVAFTPGALTTPGCATGGLGKPGERSADLRGAAFRDLRTAALCRPLDDSTPHAADAGRRRGVVGGTVLARLREDASLLRKLGQLNIGCPPAATILSRAPRPVCRSSFLLACSASVSRSVEGSPLAAGYGRG